MAGPSPCLVYSATMAKTLIKQCLRLLLVWKPQCGLSGLISRVAISLHLSPTRQGVWEYPPAVLAIPPIGRGSMTKSTGTRRLAQAACLIAVFVCGSNVVFSQDAERKVVKKVDPEYPAVLRDKG